MNDSNSSENNLPSSPTQDVKSAQAAPVAPAIGRNEPCPCGSGKKYKRCHGEDSAGIIGAPKAAPQMPSAEGLPFDPNSMDPAMMAQMAQAMQRLPKAHLHKIQTVMQRAMQGKDVTREAAELERMLPGGFRNLMEGMMGGMMPGAGSSASMSESEARKLVEQAAKDGKISAEEAEKLLAASPAGSTADTEKKGFFKKMLGK